MPGVQLIRPGTLAMRARGPARYYGGEDAAATALLETVAELGVPGARIGIADGPFAAEQAARAARGSASVGIVPPGASAAFIAPLPVGLVVDPRTATLLNRLGVRTLGEFAALPGDDVRRRFGAAGAFAHDRAAGREQATGHRAHAPARVRGGAALRAAARPRRPARLRVPGGRRASSSSACARCGSSARACASSSTTRAAGTRAAAGCIRAGSRPPTSSTACAGNCRARAPPTAGSRRRSCGCGSCPSASTPPATTRRGSGAAGPTSACTTGSPACRACSATRRSSPRRSAAAACSPTGRCSSPWGDRAPDRASDAPWPGSLPALAPASVFRERLPIALLDARGDRRRDRRARGDLRTARAVRRRRRRGRARARLGGSVAGRRTLVGRRARQARAPVPGGRRRRLRVAPRARPRGLVGRGEVRLMGLEQPRRSRGRSSSASSPTGDGRAGRRVIADGGDSPAWSRKRHPYRPSEGLEAPAGPIVPYAELHAHSTFSFLDGASTPEQLVEEAHRLGLSGLAVTDHDGFYGIVRFAEAAESFPELADGLRRRALARPERAAEGRRRPRGRAPARARPRRSRATTASRARSPPASSAGGEKGRPAYSLEQLAEHCRRRMDRAHRMPQGRGAPCARRRRARMPRGASSTASSPSSGATTSSWSCSTTGIRSTRRRNDALAELADAAAPAAPRHERGALRHPGRAPARVGARRGAGASQPRRARRVAAGLRRRCTCAAVPRWCAASRGIRAPSRVR